VLGPHGEPLHILEGAEGEAILGVDLRPLVEAVDEQGLPLARCGARGVLLGPDGRPLQLGWDSEGVLHAVGASGVVLAGAQAGGYTAV
jgi:hypothetical protein